MKQRYFAGISAGLPSYVWDSELKESVCECENDANAQLICDALNLKHELEQGEDYVAARSII